MNIKIHFQKIFSVKIIKLLQRNKFKHLFKWEKVVIFTDAKIFSIFEKKLNLFILILYIFPIVN
jgi:hypothetical protein